MSRRDDKGKAAGPPEDTLQVRVRNKNPLIERKKSSIDYEAETAMVDQGDERVALRRPPKKELSPSERPTERPRAGARTASASGRATEKSAPAKARRASAAQGPADSGRPTERPAPRDGRPKPRIESRAKAPRAPAFEMDEDATEIADGPPPPPKHDMVVLRTEKKKNDTAEPLRRTGFGAGRAEKLATDAGAVPRGRLQMRGTDAIGALAVQARVEHIEDQLPTARSPLLKSMRGFLTHEATSTLDRLLAGEYDQREKSGRGRPGSGLDSLPDPGAAAQSPKRALERLINQSAFAELDAPERAALLSAIAGTPRDVESTRSAQRLVSISALGKISSNERRQLFELFGALNPADRAMLASLGERTLNRSSALLDRDFEDALLVTHLQQLAVGGLNPLVSELGIKSDDVVGLVLATLANPERIGLEEGADGVLSMIEFGLAETSPAEYGRLWRGWVAGDLIADLPSEGQIALRERIGKVRPEEGNFDTPFRMGLDALAGLARPKGSGRRDAFIMPGGHGIDADVVARALGLLYGVGFTVAAGAGAMRALERVGGDRHRVPPAFISTLYEGGERLFVFDRIEGSAIYFRAPHGTSTKPKGARRRDPDRLIEDPTQGLESIPLPLFKQLVGVALVPRA